jgi:putative ABC transport system permease protein
VIHTVLLEPLPYPDADRIVALSNGVMPGERFKEGLPGVNFAEWQTHAQSFDHLAGYWYREATLASTNAANRIQLAPIAGDFWALTGAQPVLGRLFDSTRPSRSIVLSHKLFERQFSGDSRIIGKTVLLDGSPITVVGVLPANFRFLFRSNYLNNVNASAVEAFIPGPALVRSQWSQWFVVGHLKPAVSIESALAELRQIQANFLKAYPDRWFPGIVRMSLLPLQNEITGNSRRALWLLQTAGFFVLLIACANVANLLLARGSARSREIAIRAAVGAGVARVLRQFLAEGLLLAVAGGAIGIFIAWSVIALVKHFGLSAIPRLSETSIDGLVLAFTLSLCLISGILFGLAPAFTLRKTDLQDVLKEGTRAASIRDALRLRFVLVASQLALAIVLLSGAGLMVKSFLKMYANPPGFSPENTLLMKVALSGPQYAEPVRQGSYSDELLRRIGALPGVEACGVMSSDELLIQGPDPAVAALVDRYQNSRVSQGYFQAIGMQLLKGRWITDGDPPDVVVINETMARRAFGNRNPIGQRIEHLGQPLVVGVTANLKYSKRDEEPGPEMFRSYAKTLSGHASVTVAVRMRGNPLGISSAARTLITGIDPAQPVYDMQTLDQALTKSIAARRLNLFLLGFFAISALLIALVGIYGVMAYAVTQRTREIGIRLALGAQRGTVVRMIVAQGMRITVWGVAVGLGGALAFTRVMASLLYDVAPNDPPTFAVTLSILIACVLLACWGPALRASLVDPQVALRHE